MPITLERDESRSLIRLEGEINITTAAELKKLLLEALEYRKEIRVELERVTELDISALQMFWAFERDVTAAGVAVSLTGGTPENIATTLSDAGFDKFPVSVRPV